jgi:predicted DsbA family dithiol-disulfide isomerase
MEIRHEGDRVAVITKKSHIQAVVAVAVGIAAGLGMYFGIGALRGGGEAATAEPLPDSASWVLTPRFDVATEGRPSLGPEDAPVTIVEFVDYECPWCREHSNVVLPQLLEQYGDGIRYVARHFPFPALHPNAMTAALAVECAYEQSRFWEYRAAIFRASPPLTLTQLREHAAAVGLDLNVFDSCLGSEGARQAVAHDLLDGWELQVSGTPTFFVNGRRLRGEIPFHEWEMYVEIAGRAD